MIVLPEYVADSPYYNPLFFSELLSSPTMGQLNIYIYLAGGTSARGRIFLSALSIAGGFLFGAFVDKVLRHFGYSCLTVKEVKHINANQKHLLQLENMFRQQKKMYPR